MMTARDPYVNVMRGAVAAFRPASAAPTASRSCRTPSPPAFPTVWRGVWRGMASSSCCGNRIFGFVADPAAGAGGFEALTSALVDKGWAVFQGIEARGGLPIALADGRSSVRSPKAPRG